MKPRWLRCDSLFGYMINKLAIDYTKLGSIDMITADVEGKNFLFPSNQTALELYEQANGEPLKSEIILLFNV